MSPAVFLVICPAMELLYYCSAQMKIFSAATCLCFVKHTMSKEEPQYPELENAGHSYLLLPCGQFCYTFPGVKVQSQDLANLTTLNSSVSND